VLTIAAAQAILQYLLNLSILRRILISYEIQNRGAQKISSHRIKALASSKFYGSAQPGWR
jgi:hypothetical protein